MKVPLHDGRPPSLSDALDPIQVRKHCPQPPQNNVKGFDDSLWRVNENIRPTVPPHRAPHGAFTENT